MSYMRFLQSLGLDNGMDEGQNHNLTRVLNSQYEPTQAMRQEIVSKKLGDPKMFDYKADKEFGKNYLLGSYFVQKDNQPKFSSPEATYFYLQEATSGASALIKPGKAQLAKADAFLARLDTPEKRRQLQAAIQIPVDGDAGPKTKQAVANYLSVFEEKDLVKQVSGALKTTRNYAPLLEVFREAETGDSNYAEGELHIGQETLNIHNNNKAGIANTTRYGVIAVDYYDNSGKKKEGFPKLPNETDQAHAARFYKQRILPQVEKVKGITDESQDIVNAVASLAWNRGSLPSGLDLKSETKTQAGVLRITTTGGLHSNGVAARSIEGYNNIAAIKNWPQVKFVETVPNPKNAAQFNFKYFDAAGNVLYEADKVAAKAEGSKININYRYTVGAEGYIDLKTQAPRTAAK